ncbi:hypothetical protein [Mesorhizobium sp. B2-8-3]|uniref:hypothetical protein n=1 Tax=Mesorhizobium sp. B2-8-3 TaxID=2589905 RepID=UPI0011267FAC|nr:hypothetical protein [Mesorhizobium sp. B2-8-3]TPJ33697.1 hypothetical protein FJ418_13795 [Mesorhizobium sp. B2-8-3]
MTKTPKTTAAPSLMDAIKGGEELEKAKQENTETSTEGGQTEGGTEEGKQEEPKPVAWGAFQIEVGIAPPSRSQANTKYDWSTFPAPSNPSDPKTWPSVFIKDVGGKTISGSIKTFRDRLQKEGKTAPEFTVSVSKDPKGVRVFRKK